jgi:Phosphotransferase enzyme family
MARRLAEALGSTPVEAEPRYLRYKPGNKAMVLYAVAVAGRRTAAVVTIKVGNARAVLRRPEAAEVAIRARERCLSPEPFQFLPEIRALVEWYPARVSIPGLAFDPLRLGDALAAAGLSRPTDPPVLVSYKPERRAVQRWGGTYVKAYADSAEYARAGSAAERAARLGIGCSAPVARIDEERLLALAELPRSDGVAGLREIGAVLARLHRAETGAGLQSSPAIAQLAMARRTAMQVAWLVPELEGLLQSVLAALERGLPDDAPLVASHGDLHLDQVVPTAAGPALVDFDHLCLASPALDPATLAAHLVRGGEGDLAFARATLEELLAGYGRTPAGLDWHLAAAILGRATYPLRELRRDWPERIAGMVEDAWRLLDKSKRYSVKVTAAP